MGENRTCFGPCQEMIHRIYATHYARESMKNEGNELTDCHSHPSSLSLPRHQRHVRADGLPADLGAERAAEKFAQVHRLPL